MTGAERLEMVARMAVPYSFMLVLFILDVVAAPYPLNILLDAPFTLMMIYYCTLYRPGMVPTWLCFISGLLLDILSGYPMGLSALLFVLTRLFLVGQRRFIMAQGFMIFWFGFVVLSLSYFLVIWAILSLKAFAILPLAIILPPLILGTLAFPLISAFLGLTHKIL